MLNPTKYPVEEFYQAWRNAVLYDEHTWGAHNSISQPDHPFVKSQWAIKQAFALEADQQSRALLEKSLAGRGSSGARIEPSMCSTPLPGHAPMNSSWLQRTWRWQAMPSRMLTASRCCRSASRPASLLSSPVTFRPLRPDATRFPPAAHWSQAKPGVGRRSAQHFPRFAARGRSDRRHRELRCQSVDVELADAKAKAALNDYLYLPGSDLKGLKRNGPVKISARETGPLGGLARD